MRSIRDRAGRSAGMPPEAGGRFTNCRKGQVWSFDLLVSASVLFLIIILYVVVWQYVQFTSESSIEGSSLLGDNLRVTDALLVQPGDPSNWAELAVINASTVHSIGIVGERNVIDERKVKRMAELNSTHYDFFREELGIPSRQFSLEITDLDGNPLYSVGNSSDTEDASVLQRVGLLNGTEVLMVVRVWE